MSQEVASRVHFDPRDRQSLTLRHRRIGGGASGSVDLSATSRLEITIHREFGPTHACCVAGGICSAMRFAPGRRAANCDADVTAHIGQFLAMAMAMASGRAGESRPLAGAAAMAVD